MVLINKAINEVTVKLVYYGPGLCGKTTNLEQIYGNPKLENKGKMISMSTETDRTLFFDFMPLELGTVGGQKIRVQIYTVPGQVFYDATRKLVLRGADGVVFVADSQASMQDSNIESLENLKTNLRLNRLDPDKIALVFQYNKRDLPNLASVEEMNALLQPGNSPVVEAAAINGVGVTQTLRQAISRILDNLKNNVDVTLYDAPPLQRPAMGARSGATHSSAGVAKVAVSTAAAPRVAAPAPPPAAAPSFSAAGQQATEAFADLSDGEPEMMDSAPVAVGEEVAFDTTAPEAEDEVPFGETGEFPHDEHFDPFAATVEAATPAHDALAAALARADALVRSLETALDEARRHRDEIARLTAGETN